MHSTTERFLAYLAHELNSSPHTVAAYRADLGQLEQFLAGDSGREVDFLTVSPSDVRAWLRWLSGQKIGHRSLRRKLQSVRALYRYLMREGEVSDNPAAEVELAKSPKHLPAYAREGNLDALLDTEVDMTDLKQVRDRLIVMMLYETGIRRSEMLTLRDAWVDTDRCEMRVHGKRDKDRIVPFGTELARWIVCYRELRDQAGGRGETFFTRANGLPLYPSLVYKVVTRDLGQAGVTGKRSPHVLRHSFATSMLNAGAGLESVKELLGHESIATTQIYTHVTVSDLINNYKHAHPRALKKGGKHGN